MVVQQLIEKFVEYCSKDDTREALERKLVRPLLEYLTERFSWTLRAFQALTVLVAIQTVLLIWLLFRSFRVNWVILCVLLAALVCILCAVMRQAGALGLGI